MKNEKKKRPSKSVPESIIDAVDEEYLRKRAEEKKKEAEEKRKALEENKASSEQTESSEQSHSSHSSHSSHEHHSSHSSGKKRRKKRISFDKAALPTILTVGALILVAVIIGVTLLVNNNMLGKFSPSGDTDTASFDSSETVGENDTASDTSSLSPEDPYEEDNLIFIEPDDFNAGLEIPRASVYDADGNCLVTVVKGEGGALIKAVYHVEEDGRLFDKEYNKDGKLIALTELTDGNRTVYTVVLNDKNDFNGYTVELFGKEDHPMKQYEMNFNGVVETYSTYEYNSDGRVSRENVYSSYNVLLYYTIFAYDDNGNNVERFQYDQNNVPGIHDVLTYDEQNRVVKEENYVLDICKSYKTTEYDENGNVKEHSYMLVDEANMIYQEFGN